MRPRVLLSPHPEAVTEEEVSRALVEGEDIVAPGSEGMGNGQLELSCSLSTVSATAETHGDLLSCGEETARCVSRNIRDL